MNRKLTIAAFAATLSLSGFAQSSTNSPYSQYGVGILADQSQGFNRGMNGVGQALRRGNIVNTQNPASYSAVDSLTMIFDVGVSGEITNFKEGGLKVNAKSANVEYAVASFRLLPKLGLAFGVLPYSNVGYEYSSSTKLTDSYSTTTENYVYEGDGGLHQAFIGAGWKIAAPLSVGVNVAYLWGTTENIITAKSLSTTINTLTKTYSTTVSSYLITAGAQWEQNLNARDLLTVGATVGIGHKLGADSECEIDNTNLLNSSVDTETFVAKNAWSLPMTYSLGVGWTHGGNLFVGADATLQKWGSLDFPDADKDNTGKTIYALRSGLLKDRYQFNAGVDYVPNPLSRSLLGRVHYRFGMGYATPYYYINGQEGPKELSVSAGFGIPLQNAYNNRSVLNISAQWARRSATDLITENTFRINIGLTFNERWFAKWKVD